MAKRLYVGNLPYSTTNADLEALFNTFGKVTNAQVIQDRDTGRSKGFAFVEMLADAAAQAAINSLNDKEYEGRPLTVNEAKPRVASPARDVSSKHGDLFKLDIPPPSLAPLDVDESIEILVSPGSATPDEIAEVLTSISELHSLAGGNGIVFTVVDARNPCREVV